MFTKEPVSNVQNRSVFSYDVKSVVHLAKKPTVAPPVALPEILFITSFPPRECGIATYSEDLMNTLKDKFDHSFNIAVCALESDNEKHVYPKEPKYVLNVDSMDAYTTMAHQINSAASIEMVVIQHEFGFFSKSEVAFQYFLDMLIKPIIMVFHTVLPHPDALLLRKVQKMAERAESIIVMTHSSAKILTEQYAVSEAKITVIAHGTHLVAPLALERLRAEYKLNGRAVLSTFGLLGAGKNIETTLDALPEIIKAHPEVLFLIIGKTHPSLIKQEGEVYRAMLEAKVDALHLGEYVRFVNSYLPISDILNYLQLTDIYLFTSKDRNQAVSGTFSYAISCGCPVVSTPIPHALEVLTNESGVIVDFESPTKLAHAVVELLNDKPLRETISFNALHKMAPTAWENSALAHARLFEENSSRPLQLNYKMPDINLQHIKRMTTDFGMLQFAKISQPDLASGYTLDDNARALIALCKHFALTEDYADIPLIEIYLNFIKYCLKDNGRFLNYVSVDGAFTATDELENLEDSNGRAIWALGYLLAHPTNLPPALVASASVMLEQTVGVFKSIHSPRAMAFAIKGLYYQNDEQHKPLLILLADRLVQMYRHEADGDWCWFEGYLTYGNSVLSEALLCAWQVTGNPVYQQIAKLSFDFLLAKIFTDNSIKVILNNGWLHKGGSTVRPAKGAEQPIDVAYTIIALQKFYTAFHQEKYKQKLRTAFSWFLGNNHLHQIIYNPRTGGCYDGLEETYVNLNQGAESTLSYLMARLTAEEM